MKKLLIWFILIVCFEAQAFSQHNSNGVAEKLISHGPGLGNFSYSPSEVFKPLTIFNSSLGAPKGHATVAMHKGYLAVIYSEDSGIRGGGISFFDVSDPRNPKLVSRTENSNTNPIREAHGFGFSSSFGGDYVVLQAIHGIQFWDWTDVTNPSLLNYLQLPLIKESDYTQGAWWVFWQAPYVYVGGSSNGIYIVNALDPRNPQFIKRISTSATGGFRTGPIFAIGNLLVVSNMDDGGYATLDISDPENPVLLDALPNGPSVYSSIVNGSKILGAGIDNRLYVHDISDPTDIRFVNRSNSLGGRGGYVTFQDEFVHAGMSNNYAKVDISDDNNYVTVGTGSSGIGGRDEDFANVLGNLVYISNDHDQGSAIVPHQGQPDTKGPAINMVIPKDGATLRALASRVGLTFTDQIDLQTVNNATFIVRPSGGSALPGKYSYQTNILNFAPDAPLQPNTVYEVVVPAGGIEDLVGNPTESQFVSLFSTGSSININTCSIQDSPPAEVGESVSFTIKNSPNAGESYSWDFGDGSPATPFSSNPTSSHIYTNPGHYPVQLIVQVNQSTTSCSIIQTIYFPNTTLPPTASSAIIYDNTRQRLWCVNSDNNTITAIDAQTLNKLFEQPVGRHPRTLALSPDGTIWAASEGDATITVLDGDTGQMVQIVNLPYGSQPFGIAFSPDGTAAYVTLQGTGKLLKLNPATRTITDEVEAGPKVRGIAVSADSRRILVTRFSSPENHGEVYEIDANNFDLVRTFNLALDPGPDAEDAGRGVPNYISTVTITPDGRQAWVPSKKDNTVRGLARDGQPLTFESTVRPIVSQIDLVGNVENLSARLDLNDRSMPFAVQFSPLGDYAFVAIMGNNMVEVRDAYNSSLITAIENTGSAPQGLVLDPNSERLFVQNFLSRTVSVYDVSKIIDSSDFTAPELAKIQTVSTEILHPTVLQGKQIFYNADDQRMGRDKYISCAACHLDGGEDGRIWDFTDRGEGFRNTVTLLGRSGTAHGRVHWTGNFDEIQDFENDIRGAFGGKGFMSDVEFFAGTRSDPLGDPKAGISPELDALAAYVHSLSQVNPSPDRPSNGSLTTAAQAGKQLFMSLQCASCHSGFEFTNSPAVVLHDVGTIQTTSGSRIGRQLFGIDTPSLKGIWETAPYLHDGSALTLEEVLTVRNSNGLHGSTGNLSSTALSQLVEYLRQIDDSENGFNTPQQGGVIVKPADGASFPEGSNIEIEVDINTAGGTVTEAAFYYFLNGEQLISLDNDGSDGWGVTWVNPLQGIYPITTVVTYEDRHRTVLPTISVEVEGTELITGISVANGKPYEILDLAIGVEQYIDRNYVITSFPTELESATLVRTANDDKSVVNSTFLTLELGADVDVYIAYDSRATQLPAWLDDWNKIGEQVQTTDVTLDLYHKLVLGSSLTLGGNLAPPAAGAESNYFIILKRFNIPVPVELISFQAIRQNKAVHLTWNTASEIANFGFELQRKVQGLKILTYNANGEPKYDQWEKIAFIKGHGTTTEPRHYSFSDDLTNLANPTAITLQYRLKQIDLNGSFEFHGPISLTIGTMPKKIVLSQNYPNPFNPSTTIEFAIPKKGHTTLKIFNTRGQEVMSLVDEALQAGITYKSTFDGSSLPSGLYFYTVRSGDFVESKKMLIVK